MDTLELLKQVKRAGHGIIAMKTVAYQHVPPTLHSRTATALRRRGLIRVTHQYPRLVYLTALGEAKLQAGSDSVSQFLAEVEALDKKWRK